MRALGLPPAYMRRAPAGAGADAAAPAGSGSQQGGEEPAAAAAAAAGEEQEANGAEQQQAGDDDDIIWLSDGLPTGPAAEAGQRAALPEQAGEASTAEEPADFIALPGSPGRVGKAASEKGGELECTVAFPGVNAPPPEGADPRAWGARRARFMMATATSRSVRNSARVQPR